MHVNTCIYGCIWPYIPIYTLFWHPKSVQDLFIVHSQSGSWCMLHQADTAAVQRHSTFIQKAVTPAQLPGQAVIQMNKVPYK